MIDLDIIYKSRLPESHEAGLQAVFEAGLEQAAAAFLADQQAAKDATVDQTPPAGA